MVLPACGRDLGIKDIFLRVLTSHALFQSEDSLAIKLRTPQHNTAYRQSQSTSSPGSCPVWSWPLLVSDVVQDVESQNRSEKVHKQWRTWTSPSPAGPCCLSKLDHFLIQLFIPCLKTETGSFQIGGSLSHKPWSKSRFFSGSNPWIQTDVDN